MARANASQRMLMQRSFGRLREFARELGGANNPAVDEGSKILVKALKKVVSKRGKSAPGQPPRKRSGRFQKSMGREVVGGVMRVGSGHFTAAMLELGAVIPAKPSRRLKRGARKGQMTKATKARVIEPRPFMDKALNDAKPTMVGVSVTALQKKTKEALS